MQRNNLYPEELTNSIDECEKKFKFLQTKNFELYTSSKKIDADCMIFVRHQRLTKEFFAASEKANSLKKFLGHPLREKEFTASIKTLLECSEKEQKQRELVEKMKISIDIDYCKSFEDEWRAYSNRIDFLLDGPNTLLDHNRVVKLAHLLGGYKDDCREYFECYHIARGLKEFDENVNKLDKFYEEWNNYTERLDTSILTEYQVQQLRNKLLTNNAESKESNDSVTKNLLLIMATSGKTELKRSQPSIKEVKNIITLIHTEFYKEKSKFSSTTAAAEDKLYSEVGKATDDKKSYFSAAHNYFSVFNNDIKSNQASPKVNNDTKNNQSSSKASKEFKNKISYSK